MRSGSKFLFALATFTLGLFLTSQTAFAQQTDSVEQGVIKVRRAPVQSDYVIKFDYNYNTDTRRPVFHWRRRNPEQVQYSQPDPVVIDPNRNDSNQTMLDSSFIITFYSKQGNPAGEFDWQAWLDQYEHTFAWDDTSGIDSTTFVFSINPRGQVTCNPVRLTHDDSSSLAMQEHLLPLMKRLWVWYPASTVSDDGRRQKKVSCLVTVKVYAVREGEELD